MRQPIEESSPEPVLSRPIVDRSVPDRLRDWVEWFGVTRLVTSAVAVAVVCVGGWWLVRTPAPPPESALPVAAPNVATGSATLPPPATPPGAPPVSTSEPSTVVVHVAGEVLVPGVFELTAGGRVADAIDRAGGPSNDADVGLLNLAAPLVDGSRIYVPAVGEDVALTVDVGGSVASNDAPAGPIDVNRAMAGELEQLPGIGPATAAAIVTERGRNGPFVSVSDLERVPGIGPAKLAAIDGLVTT